MTELLMTYDQDGDRWLVHSEGREYALHCGEWLEIRVTANRWMECRLELDRDWYVISPEARFYLRKKDTYQIHL